MEVSGLSGAASFGAASGVGISTAGLSAAGTPTADATSAGEASSGVNATLPQSLRALAETLQDFTSAEILMALMLLAATREKDEDGASSAALGFLAGLALAAQIQQGIGTELSAASLTITAPALGGLLDLQV